MRALQKASDQIQKVKVTFKDNRSLEYAFQNDKIVETEPTDQNESKPSSAAQILQFFENLKKESEVDIDSLYKRTNVVEVGTGRLR